jgi:hypothetical protein
MKTLAAAVSAEIHRETCTGLSRAVHEVLTWKGRKPEYVVVQWTDRKPGQNLTVADYTIPQDFGHVDENFGYHAHLVVVCDNQLIDLQVDPWVFAPCEPSQEIVPCTDLWLTYRLHRGNLSYLNTKEFAAPDSIHKETVANLSAKIVRIKEALKDWQPV